MEKKFEATTIKSFKEFLQVLGVAEDKIDQIYSGKDHACRCGCSGKYYKPGDKSFKRILNSLKKSICSDDYYDKADLADAVYSVYPDGRLEYVNIPNGLQVKDHCYCVYFAQ